MKEQRKLEHRQNEPERLKLSAQLVWVLTTEQYTLQIPATLAPTISQTAWGFFLRNQNTAMTTPTTNTSPTIPNISPINPGGGPATFDDVEGSVAGTCAALVTLSVRLSFGTGKITLGLERGRPDKRMG